MRDWVYSLVCLLLPMGALAADAFNRSKDFYGGWIAGDVALYWTNFPEKTSAFLISKRADHEKKWSEPSQLPKEAAFSPLRPYLDERVTTQHGLHYHLDAIDEKGKVIKKYDALYIAPCKDHENPDCQKEVK